eukprot:7285379-Prymnesium_polylepis.1
MSRKVAYWDDNTEGTDLSARKTRRDRISALNKAWGMLLRPENRIIKQFNKAWAPPSSPPSLEERVAADAAAREAARRPPLPTDAKLVQSLRSIQPPPPPV